MAYPGAAYGTYMHPGPQGYNTPPRVSYSNGYPTPGSLPQMHSHGQSIHHSPLQFRSNSMSPHMYQSQQAVPGWMHAPPYGAAATPNFSGYNGLAASTGYNPAPARSPLNPSVQSFKPKPDEKEANPFFRANSPERPFVKPNSQHRTSPSISTKKLGQLNKLAPPTPLTPGGRSPMGSRGVSPVGSSFSGSTDAPVLSALGLPIVKARNYKVKLPAETVTIEGEQSRPKSLWVRQPAELDKHSDWSIGACNIQSRDIHPEELAGSTELPDTIDIYLPNDWKALHDALYEDKLAALGITREYLKHIDTVLDMRSHPSTASSPHSSGLASHFPSPPVRPHMRSGSLSFGPQTSNATPLSPFGFPARKEQPLLRRGHSSTMSMAPFPGAAALRGDAPAFTFGRQKPPFGPRDPFATERPGLEARKSDFAPASLGIKEEDEDQEKEERVPKPRPARLMSLQELSAGLGISDSEPEPDSKPLIKVEEEDEGEEEEEILTDGLPDFKERIAIEGVLGHASMPSSALLDSQSLQAEEDGVPGLLTVTHEPRRSLSAPNLHKLLSDLDRVEGVPQSPLPQSDRGYAAEHSDSEDAQSEASLEYSNPSDEERARQRRDKASSSTAGSLAMSPIAVLRNPENWLGGHESEEIISNPSDEEILASRRPSWANPLLQQQTGLPFLLHAASSSMASSANTDRRTTLNAAAPEFVFGATIRPTSTPGSFSSNRSTISKPALVPYLNPAASVFKPTFTFRADGPTLPVAPTLAGQAGHQADEDDEDVRPSHADFKRQRMQSEKGVEVWLSDLSPEPPASTLPSQPARRDENHGVAAIDNMRGFKFPPSPTLAPISPPTRLSPLSPIPPQLPPFGTIGRNTPLRSAIEQFTFVSPRKQSVPDGFGPATVFRSPTRARSPLPDFGALAEGPSSSEGSLGAAASGAPLSPSVILQTVIASEVPVSEFGGSRQHTPFSTELAPPLPISSQSSILKRDEEADSGSNTSLDMSADEAGTLGDAASEASRPAPGHNKALSRSWKMFEAILDRKIDALRLDVFSNSTPLPPPLSAEAQEALTASIIDAIKDEMPLRGSLSVSPRNGGEGISQALLLAIHETQDMLSDFAKKSDRSIDVVVEMLKEKAASLEVQPTAEETYLTKIEDVVKKAMPAVHGGLDVEAVTAKLAEAVKPQLYSLIDLAGDKRETAALILAQLEPKLAELANGNAPPSFGPDSLQTLQEHLAETISASFDRLPGMLQHLHPAAVESGNQGSLNVTLLEVQQLLKDNQVRKDDTLKDIAAQNTAVVNLMKENQAIELALAQARADHETSMSEKATQLESFEKERQRYEQEIQHLRQSVQTKEKQIDVLRSELLARATSMDNEAKEREQHHHSRLNEFQALRGGMEAELAILKTQARESSKEKKRLQESLDEREEKMHETAKHHHTEVALLKQQETVMKTRNDSLEKRVSQADRKVTELEEMLRDAQAAIHASGGSLQELRQVKEDLQRQTIDLSEDVKAVRVSEATLQAGLQAAKKESERERRERSAERARQAEEIRLLREQNEEAYRFASAAQQTSLSLLLERDVLSDSLQPSSVLFDSCFKLSGGLVTTIHGKSMPEHSQEMLRSDSSASSEEDEGGVSDISSEVTVSFGQDGSIVDKGITPPPSPPVLKRMPTVDDSGWFS